MKKFTEFSLKPFIKEALADLKFETLTPVQAEVLPVALKGHNLIVQSQTGSGKSHSFLVPIFEKVDPSLNEVQVVITAPSRELATQLFEASRQIASFSSEEIRVVNYIGGTDKHKQMEKLDNAQPHVVIGTPGRIFDLMSENKLWVQTAGIMVVDEADMTMDLGFLQVVDDIASRLSRDLQLMVFSATIPQQLEVFLNKYVSAPKVIQIQPKEVLASKIDNYLINTKGRNREELVYKLLTLGHPYLALVFCNTKKYADEVAQYLKEQGLKVATIHGDLTPRERKRTMRQIKDLEYQYVVASDLAARGIDIPGISMVINTELPKELEFFVHRVGRTGRNQLAGTAYTFVTPDDDQAIVALEKKGIEFTQVDLIRGEIREVASRHRRSEREDTKKDKDDPTVVAMINRNKKRKVKPGYKRKLNYQIKEHKRQEARRTKREQNRQARKANRKK
ncbi:DEAD/DEAH box helicase [Aerococcaceae bacterium NML191292]|nr:DEAD/DEAH box helicase [Aerococcaceae bacterium NML191292]MCW6660688.1 DEAD/DEAH box helicase [Aerococcaceae bacterium NML201209]MCW6663391.1 DEAD/DEAH box helicase [Aerococcaceae bacterium NML190073]MCW6664707.1 DEAD/DEAH box helicase [Aerococcaceae bacterium NML191219]MCW6666691.1 DEAD/DEAH box helicase [Aerococcaceae bacterium NML190938]